jgi:hypothetical protein
MISNACADRPFYPRKQREHTPLSTEGEEYLPTPAIHPRPKKHQGQKVSRGLRDRLPAQVELPTAAACCCAPPPQWHLIAPTGQLCSGCFQPGAETAGAVVEHIIIKPLGAPPGTDPSLSSRAVSMDCSRDRDRQALASLSLGGGLLGRSAPAGCEVCVLPTSRWHHRQRSDRRRQRRRSAARLLFASVPNSASLFASQQDAALLQLPLQKLSDTVSLFGV